MRIGTSYFVSLKAAVEYYMSQGATPPAARIEVRHKLAGNEIHIGMPPLKPGQRATIIPGEGRWQIEEE